MSLQSCKMYTSVFLFKIQTFCLTNKITRSNPPSEYYYLLCEHFIACETLRVADQILLSKIQQNDFVIHIKNNFYSSSFDNSKYNGKCKDVRIIWLESWQLLKLSSWRGVKDRGEREREGENNFI